MHGLVPIRTKQINFVNELLIAHIVITEHFHIMCWLNNEHCNVLAEEIFLWHIKREKKNLQITRDKLIILTKDQTLFYSCIKHRSKSICKLYLMKMIIYNDI